MIKPNELRTVEFDVSVLGGYKRETVDSFFASVADDYEKLYNENLELAQKLKKCVEKIEEYQKDEKFLKTAIINAEKLNENSLREIEEREKEIINLAKEKADNIVEKAKIEAENIAKKARIDADEAIRSCEVEAAEKIAKINASVAVENDKLISIKKEVKEFKETILMLYKSHLDSLSKIPDFVVEDNKKVSVETKKEAPAPKNENVTETETKPETREETKKDSAVGKSDDEKTAEFLINKKAPKTEEKTETDKNLKYHSFKFGTDFDVENDE